MELIDIWDENRTQVVRTVRRGEEIQPHERSVSVHCYIINQQGQVLIQKRSLSETHFQGWWSTLGGAVTHGVSSFATVNCEAQEELGLCFDEQQISWFLSFKRQKDFVDVYVIKAEVDLKKIVMNPDEVIDVKWATWKEIDALVKQKNFIVQPYFDLLKFLLKRTNTCPINFSS